MPTRPLIRIYCDTSGYQPWLKDKVLKDRVTLVNFPYENRNRRTRILQTPTNPTWEQMNLSWDEADFTWDNAAPSEEFEKIKRILKKSSQNTDTDAKHLDCAYKGKCAIFLTNDVHDIISSRDELEKLLGIKIFNAVSEEKLALEHILSIENI